MNIEASIQTITIDAPVDLAFGSATEDIGDFKYDRNIIKMPNLMTGVNYCLSASYPRAIIPIMTILESFVYNLPNSY